MMKWVLLLMVIALLPLVLYSEGFFGGKLLYSDSLNAKLNRRLQEELKKRMPKDRPFRVEIFSNVVFGVHEHTQFFKIIYATLSSLFTSIPSLNRTPLTTLSIN